MLLRGFLRDKINNNIWRGSTWTTNISPPCILHYTTPTHSNTDWKRRGKHHSTQKLERCTNHSLSGGASHYMGRTTTVYDTYNCTPLSFWKLSVKMKMVPCPDGAFVHHQMMPRHIVNCQCHTTQREQYPSHPNCASPQIRTGLRVELGECTATGVHRAPR
jgi:hypothetical protein